MTDLPSRLSAALADHYQIERELGAGGMATVYLAQDLKHRRKVALKVLRSELSASLGPERFIREITIAAGLSHPHILPLYDSGEAAGFLYYVMPFVEGQSLRQKLIRERELPVHEAIRILRDMADAMAYAHQHGVVHRDIKPENVMLSGRHALVMDFGVAKAVSEATGRQTLTTAGVALGTPTYMAPEQAVADPHVDHRADIYAWGVVAYELLAGQPPFVRATPQAMLAAHVTEAVEPVSKHRGTISPGLTTLVMRALEKRPADRWQQADELVTQLETLLTPSGGMTPTATQPVQAVPTKRRISKPIAAVAAMAVLGVVAAVVLLAPRNSSSAGAHVREPVVVVPFEVRGTTPELKDLGAQTADQITSAIEQAGLAQVVPYRVTGESEAFSPSLAKRVIKATGAGTLVTGVIFQRGDSVEVQAKLLRSPDLKLLFSLGPERSAATAPSVALGAIRERTLGAVGWYLSPGMRGLDVTLYTPPASLEALRIVEKANQLFRETGGSDETIRLLRQVVSRDTAHFSASLFLAVSFWNRTIPGFDSIIRELEIRRSRLTVGEALWLDQQIALRRSPEEEYRASIAAFRADSIGWSYIAMFASSRAGRAGEALRYFRLRDTALTFQREWQAWDTQAAQAYHKLGRFEEELALARAARAREPRSYGHLEREARALAALGRAKELEPLITQSYSLENALAPGNVMAAAAFELQAHGQPQQARGLWERALAWADQQPEQSQRQLGVLNLRRAAFLGLGRLAEFRRLDSAETAAGRTGGLGARALTMRVAILMGDTAGGLAMVDSLRSMPQEAFAEVGWFDRGRPLYFGAQLLALLGRKDDAVALLREALNNGRRVATDEALQRYWEPIRDYPPFQALVKVKD